MSRLVPAALLTVLAALLAAGCALFEPRAVDSVDDDPSWSPDGKTIAFVRFYTDRPGLYLVKPNGSGLRLLLAGGFTTPCWSPDGQWLAFSTAYEGRICKVRTNGKDLTALTDSSDCECFFPDWSKTGLLVFDSNRDDPRGASVLWVMQPDGSGKRDISQHGIGEWRSPSWSPDGSRIVFIRYYPGGSDAPEIAVIDSSGGSEVRLTDDDAYDLEPAWSGAGNRIAFSSADSGGAGGFAAYGLCVLDLDDSTRWWVADSGAMSPAWSPDGQRLCYSRQWVTGDSGPYPILKEHGKLWIVDADGRNARKVTH